MFSVNIITMGVTGHVIKCTLQRIQPNYNTSPTQLKMLLGQYIRTHTQV